MIAMRTALMAALATASLSACTPAALNAEGAYFQGLSGQPAYYRPPMYRLPPIDDPIADIRDQMRLDRMLEESDRNMQQFRDDANTMIRGY